MAEPPQKKAKKAKKEKKAAATSENPMLDAYREIVARWPRDMRHLLSASVEPERRAALWEMMSEPGDALRRRYAWAIPDERALRVLAHYGPVVEIGAGKGYWCALLRARGVVGFFDGIELKLVQTTFTSALALLVRERTAQLLGPSA